MEFSERTITHTVREVQDRVSYLRDIDIGIPSKDIEELEKRLSEATELFHDDNYTIARNMLASFYDVFDYLIERDFSSLTPHQIDSISRSDQRPTTLDYAREIFDDFEKLKGFEANTSDPAVVCGFARLNDRLL